MKTSANRFRLALGLLRQGIISVLGLVVSVAIVRMVPTRGYAYYTIVVSAISGCAVVADSGSAFALLSVAGRCWGDHKQVANVVKSVIHCMKVSWPLSVLGFAIWVMVALLRNGFSTEQAIFALLILATNSFVGLRAKIWETLLRLEEKQPAIQAAQLLEVTARLALIIVLGLSDLLKTFGALLVLSLGQALTYFRLKYSCRRDVGRLNMQDANFGPIPEVRALILRQLPNSIFFAIQGQLSVGLLSLLSNADHIAAFGALSRFSAASGVIQAFASLYLIPKFARLEGNWQSVFWRSIALVGSLGMTVPFLAIIAPHLMLSVLGPNYGGLVFELRLLALGDVLNCILSVAWTLLASRGNNYFAWVYIPINLLAQVIGILTLHVDTLVGVILLNFLSSGSLLTILILEYRRSVRRSPV